MMNRISTQEQQAQVSRFNKIAEDVAKDGVTRIMGVLVRYAHIDKVEVSLNADGSFDLVFFKGLEGHRKNVSSRESVSPGNLAYTFEYKTCC